MVSGRNTSVSPAATNGDTRMSDAFALPSMSPRDADAITAHTSMPHFARWRAAAAECLEGQAERTDAEVLFPSDYR